VSVTLITRVNYRNICVTYNKLHTFLRQKVPCFLITDSIYMFYMKIVLKIGLCFFYTIKLSLCEKNRIREMLTIVLKALVKKSKRRNFVLEMMHSMYWNFKMYFFYIKLINYFYSQILVNKTHRINIGSNFL